MIRVSVIFCVVLATPHTGHTATITPFADWPSEASVFSEQAIRPLDALEVLRNSHRNIPGPTAPNTTLITLHSFGIFLIAAGIAQIAPRPQRHVAWAAAAMSRMR